MYIDMGKMEGVWDSVLTDESPEIFMKAHMILLRGIHYGLFLTQFEGPSY